MNKKTLQLIVGFCVTFFVFINCSECIDRISWQEDYDKRAKSVNSGLAMPHPWFFEIDYKTIYTGVDISHHNKILIYEHLKDLDFIYHKATEGSDYQDSKFSNRMWQFVRMGIPCGAYHHFTTSASGKTQFENFKNNVENIFPLKPVLKITHNNNFWSKEKLNKELAVWIKLCEKHYGVKPIIYCSDVFYKAYNLQQHDCEFWSSDDNTNKPLTRSYIQKKNLTKVKGMLGFVRYSELEYDLPFNEYSGINNSDGQQYHFYECITRKRKKPIY